MYMKNGDRYDGEWKNDNKEGKGILYSNKGDKYVGDFRIGFDGKGIYYWSNGNRFEGDFRNGKRDGKGIMYYNDGDRKMGDYSNDYEIGKHVILTGNGIVKQIIYK